MVEVHRVYDLFEKKKKTKKKKKRQRRQKRLSVSRQLRPLSRMEVSTNKADMFYKLHRSTRLGCLMFSNLVFQSALHVDVDFTSEGENAVPKKAVKETQGMPKRVRH